MKCFYHSADLDGHCSGAIVNRAYPDCELIGINYGDEFPWDTIQENEIVYMVDFSLQPFEDMEKLNSIADLVWIDHHKSAIEEAHSRGFISTGGQSLEIGKGACELCWEFLFPLSKSEAVRLLGRYDVWDLQPGTLELQNGLRMHDTLPTNTDLWESLFGEDEDLLKESLHVGKVLLRKKQMDDKSYVKSFSFETEIDGLHVVAVNRGMTNSQLFESVYDPEKHDGMLTFVWRKGQWTVSIYSDQKHIDASIICKARGGGGHKGAAGFQCKELPFKLK
jgi:oligoribonuclease NrnB/cAMP/cGMP phosphodiesterase (DHH superfamily)